MTRPAREPVLSPRKIAVQLRAARTLEAIIEAAARILESHGLEGYTTNAIAARAGVSIGSLYQYFPNKDAITLALISREATGLRDEVRQAAGLEDWRQSLELMIEAAVRHQLRRPRLARLLDIEELRLPNPDEERVAGAIHMALRAVLDRAEGAVAISAERAATDIIGITRGMADIAGRDAAAKPEHLRQGLRRAVFGYLAYSD